MLAKTSRLMWAGCIEEESKSVTKGSNLFKLLTTPNGCATHSGLHSCLLQSSLVRGLVSWSHISSSTSYSISVSTS